MRRPWTGLLAISFLSACLVWPAEVRAGADRYSRTGLQRLTASGGRVDWSPDGATIYFDRRGTDGFYDVWRMDPDGEHQRCLTCYHPQLPNRNQGQPAAHPDGRHLVFQVEKAEHAGAAGTAVTNPGAGRFNDLWVMDLTTTAVHQLTNVDADGVAGSLHPHFSPDGTRLLWTDICGAGGDSSNRIFDVTRLAVAEFSIDGVVRLDDVTYFDPGPVPGFRESHGWSADGASILFSGSPLDGMSDVDMDIWRMDLANPGQAQRLTFSSGLGGEAFEWDEHARLSPAGDAFIWVSSQPLGAPAVPPAWNLLLQTELWIADADGSNATRLTWFNDPGSLDSFGRRAIVADNDWSPDGKHIVFYVQLKQDPDPEQIWVLDLATGPTRTTTARRLPSRPRWLSGCDGPRCPRIALDRGTR